MISHVTAFAPATVANVGPCFDRAGFAVGAPGDRVTVEWNDIGQIRVVDIIGDGGKLPRDPAKNTSAVAAREVLRSAHELRGVDIWLEKQMPLYSGLGSSAASGAAAAVAVNRLLGDRFTKHALLPACLTAEEIACGARHADNAAPSLLGGLVTIDVASGNIANLALPFAFSVVLVTPDTAVPTAASRAALAPIRVEVENYAETQVTKLRAARTLAEFAAIIDANEFLERARGPLISGFPAAKAAGLAAGASAVTISGSGPSVVAIVENAAAAEMVRVAIVSAFAGSGLASASWVTTLDTAGARVV